jgi:hypothetical protein
MSLGSKKRDYVTSDRAVRASLIVHDARISVYMTTGMAKGDASKLAYEDLMSGKLDTELKAKIKELSDKKNKK